MPEISLSDWNRFLDNYSDAHVLQTGEWGELKSAFGWDAVRIVCGDIGGQILFRKLALGLTVGYMPKPVNGEQFFEKNIQFWNEVDDVCRKRRAIFLKVEPDTWEPSGTSLSSFQSSRYNIQPPRTIIVDLKGREDDILVRMKQKTRYNIRLATKKGVTVRIWDDLEAFHQMMLITGQRDNFGVHSLEYYRRVYELFQPVGMAEILLAEFEDKPLAALMVFARGRRSWYMYGASNNEERNRMPTYLLQWEAMRWARERGAEEYDLWGIPDEEESALEEQFTVRSDGLWGVYRFKRGFGGEVRRAQQAMDKIYNPMLYKLYLWRMAGRETV